jgi:hypothetical protein
MRVTRRRVIVDCHPVSQKFDDEEPVATTAGGRNAFQTPRGGSKRLNR